MARRRFLVGLAGLASAPLLPLRGSARSVDAAALVEALARDAQALALHFDLDGERLLLGSFAGTAYLAHIDLQSGTTEPAPTPHWGRDPVSYIGQNPASRAEYAIATLGRSMYLSKDGARTWNQIADRGRVR